MSHVEMSKTILNRNVQSINYRSRILGLSPSKSVWTEEELKILKENPKLPRKELHKLLPNKTYCAIKQKVRNLGLRIKDINTQKTRTLNENFWSKITYETAYWGGFCAADSCVIRKGEGSCGSDCFRLFLGTKDKAHIEKFKSIVNYDGDVSICNKKSPSTDNTFKQAGIMISAIGRWKEDLENFFGIVPRKTYRIPPPNIKDNLMKLAYIVGYIDGDGCICARKDKRISIKVVSSSYNIVKWIFDVLESNFPYQVGIRKRKVSTQITKYGTKVYNYVISGLPAAIVFYYLKQIPCDKLSRKWENPNVLCMVNKLKDKNPEKFNKNLDFSNTTNISPFPTYNNQSEKIEQIQQQVV